MVLVRQYDNRKFDFAGTMREMLGVDDLSTLRSDATVEEGHSLYKSMEQASLHRKIVKAMSSPESAGFYRLYRDFIQEEIARHYDEPILFQSRPTARIVFMNIAGEPRYHRDRDYGHDLMEVNYIVPLTDSLQSASVWIETSEGANDHRPIDMKPGQYLEFNGASLSHGVVANISGRSRVSFDFRVIPESKLSARHIVTDILPAEQDPRVFTRMHA
jgi:hypothetical protein